MNYPGLGQALGMTIMVLVASMLVCGAFESLLCRDVAFTPCTVSEKILKEMFGIAENVSENTELELGGF